MLRSANYTTHYLKPAFVIIGSNSAYRISYIDMCKGTINADYVYRFGSDKCSHQENLFFGEDLGYSSNTTSNPILHRSVWLCSKTFKDPNWPFKHAVIKFEMNRYFKRFDIFLLSLYVLLMVNNCIAFFFNLHVLKHPNYLFSPFKSLMPLSSEIRYL